MAEIEFYIGTTGPYFIDTTDPLYSDPGQILLKGNAEGALVELLNAFIASPTGTKYKITPEGGYAIKLVNKTGAASVKGTVVTVYSASAIDNAVAKIVVDVPDVIGVLYENGVADGTETWVVISGIAQVYFIGNTTRGHIARGFINTDAGYVSGQALSEAYPAAPFGTDKHFYEIGHVLESRTGAGLANVVLHFN